MELMGRNFDLMVINGIIYIKYGQMLNCGIQNFKENESLNIKNMLKES